ncbi:uncharacterized protein BJX67DRAFT_379131 [Aspergillus lucknowensis]|uniref:Uncharacterized protein n=1 Tax=Aspergillus lucknowensis TaxID=176173 RepID=A0ABR4LYH2_9EURO
MAEEPPHLIDRIWEGILLNHPRRTIWHDLAFELFDQKRDDELVDLMVQKPYLTGLIYAEYGMKSRWDWAAQTLNDTNQVLEWHRIRSKKLHWEETRGRVDAGIQLAVQGRNGPVLRRRRFVRVQIDIELLQLEEWTLTETLNNVMRDQFGYTPLWVIQNRTPCQQWYEDTRNDIVAYLQNEVQATQQEIQRLQQALPQNMSALIPAPPLPTPIPTARSSENCNSCSRIVEKLLRKDALEPILMLRRLGLFNPRGYTRMGYTFLHEALAFRRTRIAGYLASLHDIVSIRHNVATPGLNANFPYHHLDTLVLRNWPRLFERTWTRVRPTLQAAAPNHSLADVLHRHSVQVLCTWASHALATTLSTTDGLNLALIQIQPGCNWTNWAGAQSTPWHLAMKNPNLDFLDFLDTQIHATISQRDGAGRQPLDIALADRADRTVTHLIHLGHATEPAAYRCLSQLPDKNDPVFRALFDGMGANIAHPTRRGTFLHYVMWGLHHHIQHLNDNAANLGLTAYQRQRRKAAYTQRAGALIQEIKGGNATGNRPDVAAVDVQNRTALALARQHRLPRAALNFVRYNGRDRPPVRRVRRGQ